MTRFTKQDRIDQLESWNEHYKAEIERLKNREATGIEWRKKRFEEEQARQDALKAALGRIIKIVDRVISQRRSTEDERSIKAIAKEALNESKST